MADVTTDLSRFLTQLAAGVVEPSAVLTFATLPTSPKVGTVAAISDGDSVTWGATLSGGGANQVLCWWNGSNWTVAGK